VPGGDANSFVAGGICDEGNLILRNVTITGITATGGIGDNDHLAGGGSHDVCRAS
jgi:hypothetical protein